MVLKTNCVLIHFLVYCNRIATALWRTPTSLTTMTPMAYFTLRLVAVSIVIATILIKVGDSRLIGDLLHIKRQVALNVTRQQAIYSPYFDCLILFPLFWLFDLDLSLITRRHYRMT